MGDRERQGKARQLVEKELQPLPLRDVGSARTYDPVHRTR